MNLTLPYPAGPRKSMRRGVPWFLLISALIASLSGSFGYAQDFQSTDTLKELQSQLGNDLSLTEERRAALTGKLQTAAQDRAQLEQYRTSRSAIEDKLQSSDALTEDYKNRVRDIQNAPATMQRRLGQSPNLANIETEISLVQSQRDAWSEERTEALDTLSNLARNETAARDRIAEISRRRADEPPQVSNIAEPSDVEDRINTLAAAIHRQLLDAELSLLELRLRSGPALNSIRTARIAWLDAAIAEADTLLIEMQEAATQRRQGAAAQRATEARRFLSQLSESRPELQGMARENLSLVDSFESLSTQIEQANNVRTNRKIRYDF